MYSILGIGSNLAVARRARGMTQSELGALLGVHQQQVARWEASGYRSASLDRVAAVAQVLGIRIETSPALALPLVAEQAVAYGSETARAVTPARDLGEVAARIRADGVVLRAEWGFGRIGVFGSFADGTQTPHSDVDLLVEFADRDRVRGLRFMAAANHLEELLGRPVDFVQPHLLKDRLRPRVLEDVVYVWSA